MDKSAIFHLSESSYSSPLTNSKIELRLCVKKDDDIKKVELVFNDKYFFHEKVKEEEIKKRVEDEYYYYYIKHIELKDLRFAYVFKLTTKSNEVYYYSENGITKTYDIKNGFYNFFQVSFINDLDVIKVNEKFANRVFYQIFVDRFSKSKDNSNPRINIKWGEEVEQKTIAGGNLKGIEEKINYLLDLGVNGIYLTPIFKSKSNHKYDVKDYLVVDQDFGTSDDLKDLVNLFHKNNIVIILDLVFNHISFDSFLFQDVIKNGKESKYFDYFFIKGDEVDIENVNYETFAYCKDMPKLNLNNLSLQDYLIKVIDYYIDEYKIDGFRLDVSDEVPHFFWNRVKNHLKVKNKESFLIGENWHNAHSHLEKGNELDSIMNYSITYNSIRYFAKNELSSEEFKFKLNSLLMRYQTNINYNLLNLLSSHDTYRFLNECNFNKDKLILAYSFLLFYVGIPMIYYGDEILLDGGYDPKSRACFNWNYKEEEERNKTRQIFKELIKLRKELGLYNLDIDIETIDKLLVINRFNDKVSYKLYINNGDNDKEYKLALNKEEIIYSFNVKQNKIKENSYSFLITKGGK